MSARDDAMEFCARVGRWSFTSLPVGGQRYDGQSLLYTGPLASHFACQWTINLCGMRYHGGPLVASVPTPGNPTDNQVDAQSKYTATVTWGVDGALERAVVDYPWGGCTFGVLAALVRVDISIANAAPVNPTPLLSGFLTPAANVITAVMAPTFTTLVQVFAAGVEFNFPVPTRASAYRLWIQSGTITAGTIALTQLTASGGGPQTQDDGFAPTLVEDKQANAAGYYPLHPQSEYVKLRNTSVTNTIFAGLTFLLDMG